jgi:transcriptional regulator with XRE-family HTH domain
MGEHLRTSREALHLSTQAAAEKAAISTGYLFKLESGYVGSPSPRVLHRLAGVLKVPYWQVMGLAGYVTPERDDAGERMPELPSPADPAPTNQRIVELLDTVLAELRDLGSEVRELRRNRLEQESRPTGRGIDTDAFSGGYQPDPAVETTMTIETFFNALVDSFPREGDLLGRLRRSHETMLADQKQRIIDEASRHNLALTLAVLAGYRELSPGMEDRDLLPVLRKAFVEPQQRFVHSATRAALDSASDPFAVMVDISRERERHAFGEGFEFSHPQDDGDRYTAQVERCYYHDVLQANRAEQLTPIFCAFDVNWIDAIDPARDGFEFERPTTIGTGGVSCPFRFRRTIGGAGLGS